MSSSVMGGIVGARIKRREDVRILTGTGRYIDDAGDRTTLTVHFVRSTVPHGRITNLAVDAARELEGVVAVITGEDMAAFTNPINLGAPSPA